MSSGGYLENCLKTIKGLQDVRVICVTCSKIVLGGFSGQSVWDRSTILNYHSGLQNEAGGQKSLGETNFLCLNSTK